MSGVGLFLPGGGAAGAIYQIAVLAALEDSIEGWSANNFSAFYAASSGATVATALAGGCGVRRLYRALLDPSDDYFPLERKHILKMDIGGWARAGVAVVSSLRKGMSSAMARSPQNTPAALWEELDSLYDSLPPGLFSLDRYERFFAERLSRRGVVNSFASLQRPLRIVAHALDSGDRVFFGGAGSEHVPVTRACMASMALPPFFSPVKVGDGYCINAGAAQVEAVDCAASMGMKTLVVVNPMVPVRGPVAPPSGGEPLSLAEKGAMWITNQAHRVSQRVLLEEVLRRIEGEGMRVIVIEPEPTDTLMFTYNPTSFATRRTILEHVYRTTRERVSQWPVSKLSLIPPPPPEQEPH